VLAALATAAYVAGGGAARAAPHATPTPKPSVSAQPPPLTDTLTGDALRDYQTARVLLQGHDDVGARVRFSRLYDRLHDARLLANIALCEKNLGHPVRAAALFDRALSEGAALFTPDQRTQIRELLDASRAAAGRIRVMVDVPGATIVVDDHVAGTSPAPVDLAVDRGPHRVRVTKAGYRDWTRDVTVGDAGLGAVNVALEPDTRGGAVRVVTARDNTVTLDGRVVSKGSGQVRVVPGTHALVVAADGMSTYRADVAVREGETRTVEVTLHDDRRAPTWLWVVGGTVLGVAVVVAAASVFHAPSTHAGATGSVSSPLTVSW
jgi:hypothetical protein